MARSPVALLAVLLLAGSVRGQEEPVPARAKDYPDGIMALVEGSPITRYELELACLLQRPDYAEMAPDAPEARAVRSEVLDELTRQRVLVARAKEEGLEFTKADQQRLDDQLSREARRYGGAGGLKEVLARVGVPYEFLVSWRRTGMLVNKLLVRKISPDIYVSPAELRQFYEANLRRFERPGETRFRQIVAYRDPREAVRIPDAARALIDAGKWDATAYLTELRHRCKRGEGFAALALDGSLGVKHDSEIVVEAAASLVPPLDEVVTSLEPGELSEVVEGRGGTLFLVQLIDRRERGPLPFEQVQGEIENDLKDEIWRRRVATWIDEVVGQAFVVRFLPESSR